MATPTGPSLELATLRREFSTLRGDIQQIKRQVSRQPRIPEPVATGGGPIGVAELFANPESVTVSTGPGSGLNREDVTYGAPTIPFGFDGDTDWISTDGSRLTLTPGWYSAICEFALVWGTAAHSPDYFKPVIFNGAAGHDWDKLWVPATNDNVGFRGLHHFLDIGMQYAADSSFVMQAQCAFNASPGSATLWESRISWKVCKWS